jgi:hypothetical protein
LGSLAPGKQAFSVIPLLERIRGASEYAVSGQHSRSFLKILMQLLNNDQSSFKKSFIIQQLLKSLKS